MIVSDAEVNAQDDSGNTALHYAAVKEKKDIVKYLLEQKADANLVNIKK